MDGSVYESDRILNEYLLFHYGRPGEVLPYDFGPREALGFAERCVTECIDPAGLPEGSRALDLGCAVGGSSFVLSRWCAEVVGIDYSAKFIAAARKISDEGGLDYQRADEGELTTPLRAVPPEGANPERISFAQGDAERLPDDFGTFDVVLMANLIDRLPEPRRCLRRLPELLRPGGVLVITSPYTWMPEFTAREHWIGGREIDGRRLTTETGLREALHADFSLEAVRDLPFLIREHARKYQWSVAQATTWSRKVAK